jgi:hypothetical protein
MPNFRICFLYGKCHLITINEDLITLDSFRKTIERLLPPFREVNDYIYVVSGKPPRKLNLNNEEEFNVYRTLITHGCYVWVKLLIK